jgi:hypothetical protein
MSEEVSQKKKGNHRAAAIKPAARRLAQLNRELRLAGITMGHQSSV